MSCDELVLEVEGADDELTLYPDGYIPDHSIPASKLDVTVTLTVDGSGDLTISLT